MIAPVVSGASLWAFATSTETSTKLIAGLIGIVAILAALAAPMLFLHGRSYEHDVTVLPDD